VAADSTAPDTGQVIETSAVLRDAKEPHPNNIFFASSAQVQSVISGFHCTTADNITHPQELDLGGANIDQDPKFVNAQGKDYRLQPGSPAVDAAVPSSGPGVDHDFAGTPRPQGARKDIGAFELRP
jgi:hypothetical protein